MNPDFLKNTSNVWTLFHVLILFMLLYQSRYSRKKTMVLTCLCMIPLMAVNVVLMIRLGTEQIAQLFLVTCTLPSLLFFFLMSKDRSFRFLFTFCVADTIALWILCATRILEMYLGGDRFILAFVLRLIALPLIEYVAVRYVREPYRELQNSVARGWGVFAAMSFLYYILLTVMTGFPVAITERPQEMPAYILILVLMPMTYGTIFVALYRQLQLYRKQQSARIWQEKSAYLEAQLENQQQIRKMKHDITAYTATLSGLLAAGDIGAAKVYLQQVKTFVADNQKSFCANPYINALLGHYHSRFEEQGILLKTDIQIGEEAIPHMELCQILSNGLENAWTALGELPTEGKKGGASVQMRYNREYLVIRIKNHCRQDLVVAKGTIPHSTKAGHGHGFGLPTIRETARKLGGEMSCYTEQGMFILDVMVPMGPAAVKK